MKVDFDTLKEGVATGKIDAVQVTAGELKPVEQGLDIKVHARRPHGLHPGRRRRRPRPITPTPAG